jgi:hypothetical protein
MGNAEDTQRIPNRFYGTGRGGFLAAAQQFSNNP